MPRTRRAYDSRIADLGEMMPSVRSTSSWCNDDWGIIAIRTMALYYCLQCLLHHVSDRCGAWV